MTNTSLISRRQTLKLAGVGLGLTAVGSNTAAAKPSKYIVGTASNEATRAAKNRATSVSRVLDFGSTGTAVAGRFPVEALAGLSKRPDVRYIEADGKMYANAGTADIDSADAEVPWGVDRVDAEKVHTTSTGSGGHVAIIDTGIDDDHPDFSGVLGAGKDFTGSGGWDDDNGHGTHCAGIAGAVDDGSGVVGVATAATLHAIKVLNESGSGYYSDVAAGIKYVADQGWDVASLSLGGPLSSVIEDACTDAYDRGVLLVAAAGNDGSNVKNTAPAAYATVVAVSATDDSDDLAWFSNVGKEVELAAPGVRIYSTVPGGSYGSKSGTSMACPHVSGAAGILMAAGKSHTSARAVLQDTAEDLGRAGRDNDYGYGILDVEAAVASLDGGTDDTTDTTAPSAPTDLAAPAKTETSVDLTWSESTDDVGVDYYTVYLDGSAWGDSTDTAETVTGLSSGTTYDVAVTATDAAGNESEQSATLTVTTESSDSTVTAPVIDAFTVESGNPNNPHADVEMSWQVSNTADVTLELYDDTATLVDSWSVGSSGSQTYQEKHASPKTFTAKLVATNAAGTVSEERSVTA